MTQTILRIDASARTQGSVSRALADRVIERLAPDTVISRDLGTALPQLDADWITANFTPQADRSAEQRDRLALSDILVEELMQASTLVISVPIYNFGIPASLKAWIDLVARVGVTFRYTPEGPKGLLENKRAVLVLASGGTEVDSPVDFATPYLRHVLGFIGITDIQVVRSDRQMVDAKAAQVQAEADLAAIAA